MSIQDEPGVKTDIRSMETTRVYAERLFRVTTPAGTDEPWNEFLYG